MRAGYDVRTPRESDLPLIVDSVNAAARANDSTAGAQTEDEFLRAWAQMDSAEDAWVVTGPNDGIYGYGHVIAALREGRIFADAYTHPDHVGAGIGTTLLTHIEARAAAMTPGIASGDEATDVSLVNYVLLGGDADRMLRAADTTWRESTSACGQPWTHHWSRRSGPVRSVCARAPGLRRI